MVDLNDSIRDALGRFWDERALPIGPGGAEIVDDLIAPVESLTAVEVLVELDAVVGNRIPNSVIQAGGYNSKDEFIEKLSAKVIEFIENKS